MTDQSDWWEYFTHTVVAVTYPVLHSSTWLLTHARTTRYISQSKKPLYTLIAADKGTAGGICDAASGQWLLFRAARRTNDPSEGLVIDAVDNGVVKELQLLQTGSNAESKVDQQLQSISKNTGIKANNDVVAFLDGSAQVVADVGEYFALLSFNLGGPEDGGHMAAIHNCNGQLTLFDINYGIFEMPANRFAGWFTTYMYTTGYQLAFKTFDCLLYRK